LRTTEPPTLRLATFNGKKIAGDYTPAPLQHDFSQNGYKKPLRPTVDDIPYQAFRQHEDSIPPSLHEDIPLTDQDFDSAEAFEKDWSNALARAKEEIKTEDQDIPLAHWLSLNINDMHASTDFQHDLKAVLSAKRHCSDADIDSRSIKNSQAISFLSYHSASIRSTLKSALIPDDVILSTLIDQDTIDNGAPLPAGALDLAQRSIDLIKRNCEGYSEQNQETRIATCIRLLEMTEAFLHDYIAMTESEPASYLLNQDEDYSDVQYMVAQQHITRICEHFVNNQNHLAAFFNIHTAEDAYGHLGRALLKDLNKRGYMFAARPYHQEILVDTLLSDVQESFAGAQSRDNICDSNNIASFPLITRTEKGKNFSSVCMQNIPNTSPLESDLHDLTACLNKCIISFATKAPANETAAQIYTLSTEDIREAPEPNRP